MASDHNPRGSNRLWMTNQWQVSGYKTPCWRQEPNAPLRRRAFVDFDDCPALVVASFGRSSNQAVDVNLVEIATKWHIRIAMPGVFAPGIEIDL
jgi:hypothetical protein